MSVRNNPTPEYSCRNKVTGGNGTEANLNLKDVLKFYAYKKTDGGYATDTY